ncbi:hypothetical protein [Rhizobium alvei]|uniref:DUF945 domain-containing protein n=1 Tax=Rhizobium alvei TaxID=1132659 RepID=A0ABT8YJ79_9HYPH|nr:hypothetical protein [Rhizobium alvei]MDO6963751.1 hypothetical protein [Rhizobium alvei]
MKLNRTFGILLASTAFFGLANSAFALDGNEVLAKINAALEMSQAKLAAASVEVDGDNVTLTGATLTVSSAPQPLSLGDISLEEVAEDEGSYDIGKVTFQDLNVDKDGTKVTASDIYMTNMHVPATPDLSTVSNMLLAETFHVGPFSVAANGKEVFSASETNANYSIDDDETKVDFDMAITGLKADLSTVPDPKSQEAIKALGLETVAGEITMKGDWTMADGKMTISEYAFDFNDIGRIDLNMSLSGYTPALIKSMQEAVKTAEQNPDKAAGQQALGMSMMGLMAQLSYNGASIRFDDAGITAKVLDYAGKQQGVDGKQFAQSIKGMLPMMLGQLNMPDLQTQIVSAANAFLDDPKSLTVSAEPAQPLPFPQIMGAGMGNPADLVKTLNVKVTAND